MVQQATKPEAELERDRAGRHVGVIGLAVMGENLALNIARNGFRVAVYNRSPARTQEFMEKRAQGYDAMPAYTIEEFVASLERPRRIIVLVKAGPPVDAVISELAPHLEEGDIIVDGGNSHFLDTERRSKESIGKPYRFVGMGVSGGEEGALWGPSLMPGGPRDAYDVLEPMLVAIAAKTEAGPCVTYIGPGGSGHYVKMVHNGIEYGDMQLIAETYDIMRRALGMTAPDMAPVFARWNEGKLSSFLIEITAKALAVNDPETGQPLVDLILDAAEQKGTGRWTSESALELGTPIPVIDAAVIARSISSMKEQRIAASKVLHGPQVEGDPKPGYETSAMLDALENALYFSKISSYAQGMALLRAASHAYEYNLNLSEIARIWKGGCIIRAKLLDPIREAFSADPDLENLLLAPHITETVNANVGSSREVVRLAVALGIPVPAQCAALSYVDSYREERLPANLIQALRDFFGAHTFKRIDKPGTFHADWSTGAAIEL